MTDFIDDFLEGLENDKPKPRTDFSRLNKILMSAGPNQGTIMFAPFMDPKSSKFYQILRGVREYKGVTTLYHEGNDAVWIKILPEASYGELTDEEKNLYSEVVGMFDEYKDYIEGNTPDPWSYAKFRSYSLFQGIVLSHVDTDNKSVDDNIGQAALIMFPSANPITELSNAITAKINNLKNKSWLTSVFSPKDTGREGALSIKFTKAVNPGYDTSVSFEFNSAFSTIIDRDFHLTDEVKSLFTDFTESFLGWENGDGKLFNKKLFEELKKGLAIELSKISAKPKSEQKPENKNGQDPMLENQAPKTETVTESGPSEGTDLSNKPAGDFPF